MSFKIVKNLVPESKYDIKCPYMMSPDFIVVHNTANDASAENEIAYMIRNNNEVSFHYAVDDKEAVQGIPLNRNAWHAGDGGSGNGNRNGIAIEICYSKSGGSRFEKAEKNAAKLIAQLLKERGWGTDKIKKHQDFDGKYCPHRTLDMGWNRFIDMVNKELKGTSSKPSKPSAPTKKPDQILTVGSVVKSVPMSIKAGIKKIYGDECVNIPALGGYFPTRFVDEYDASDGKKDQYLANDKAKVVIKQTTVDKVNKVDNLVRIHGVWVKPGPLTEIKDGK